MSKSFDAILETKILKNELIFGENFQFFINGKIQSGFFFIPQRNFTKMKIPSEFVLKRMWPKLLKNYWKIIEGIIEWNYWGKLLREIVEGNYWMEYSRCYDGPEIMTYLLNSTSYHKQRLPNKGGVTDHVEIWVQEITSVSEITSDFELETEKISKFLKFLNFQNFSNF